MAFFMSFSKKEMHGIFMSGIFLPRGKEEGRLVGWGTPRYDPSKCGEKFTPEETYIYRVYLGSVRTGAGN